MIFAQAFGESWHGEILGQVKLFTGTITEAKGSLNSKSPSTVEADWWGFFSV